MNSITQLVVTKEGTFVPTVLKEGTIIIINNKNTGAKVEAEVKSCTEDLLIAVSVDAGQLLTLEPSVFGDILEVAGIIEAGDFDLSGAIADTKEKIDEVIADTKEKIDETLAEIRSKENVQKAKEAGEKALKTGKKALVGLLGAAADLLQKATEQLDEVVKEETFPTEEEQTENEE